MNLLGETLREQIAEALVARGAALGGQFRIEAKVARALAGPLAERMAGLVTERDEAREALVSRARDLVSRARDVVTLAADLRQARETIRRLNRRCQTAESAVRENLQACLATGVSPSRQLAVAAEAIARQDLVMAREHIRVLAEALQRATRGLDDIRRAAHETMAPRLAARLAEEALATLAPLLPPEPTADPPEIPPHGAAEGPRSPSGGPTHAETAPPGPGGAQEAR